MTSSSRPRFRPLAFLTVLLAIDFTLFGLLRLAFIAAFLPPGRSLGDADILHGLNIGLRFDARLAALIVLIPFLGQALPWLSFRLAPRRARLVWTIWLTACLGAALFVYAVDFGAYAYLKSRVSAALLTFLETPDIALTMVWQSYPVLPIAAGLLAALAAYAALLARLTRRAGAEAGSVAAPAPLWRRIGANVSFFLLLAILVYGKVSRFPLRWSDAMASRDRFAGQVGLNPVLYFYDTLAVRSTTFDEKAARRSYEQVAAYLGVDHPDPASLRLERQRFPAGRTPIDRPNVVFIMLETFAAFKTGILGHSGLDPSPNFDRLARAGWLFDRYYSPMENTSRSLFAALFGIPDVSPHTSASRNPMIVEQHTILTAFRGYEKMYFLGGSANWGNIRGMLAHNIPGLHLYEEGSYRAPVHDVWGISDPDLLLEANDVLRRQTRPFVAFIQTAGNHRPYRIPERDYGFEADEQEDRELLRRAGFFSSEEYNAFRFLDHALGVYFAAAEREDYFKRTIFVLFGDHGTTGGAPDRSFGWLALASFHVPLVIYGPDLLGPARVVSRVTSELDLLPTVAGIVGVPYTNTTFGRDILAWPDERPSYAFTYTAFQVPPLVGWLGERFYANVPTAGGPRELHDLGSADPLADVSGAHPDLARWMGEMALGTYEMARYAMHHNPPRPHPGEREGAAAAGEGP